jgi:MFS family permease
MTVELEAKVWTTRHLFFGWRIVAAAFVLAVFGWGLGFYGPPIYLHAVILARGWSLSLVSAAVTVHLLAGALVVANLTALHRRFGLPLVTSTGSAALASGVICWALAAQPWQLLAASVVSGCGWGTMSGAAVNALVAPWFVRLRPAALSWAYNGSSVGGVMFSPLWVAAIGAIGFPAAASVIGAVTVITILFLTIRYFSKTPASMGLNADGHAAVSADLTPGPQARPLPGPLLWRDARFRTLATGMALGLFAQIGLLAHLFSLLVPRLGEQLSGIAIGLATAAAVAGRTLMGSLTPARADRRLLGCASYVVQVAGSLALLGAAGQNPTLLIVGVALFGAGIGNATSLPPLIAQSEFATQDVGRAVALIVAISQAAYAFAPAAFGLLREAAAPISSTPGAAPFLFGAAALLQAAAIVAFLIGRGCCRQD